MNKEKFFELFDLFKEYFENQRTWKIESDEFMASVKDSISSPSCNHVEKAYEIAEKFSSNEKRILKAVNELKL